MLRNNRRSSLVGSQHSIPSRRSSCNLKDGERIQIAEAQKKRNFSPQLLISILCGGPFLLYLHIYAITNCDASFLQFLQMLWSENGVLYQIFPSPFSSVPWKILVFITLLQLIFHLVLPKDFVTVVNSMGERECHPVNSFHSCLLIVLLFIFGSSLGFYKASIIYINWTQTLSLLNLISIIMVLFLYMRQRNDDFTTSNIINGLFFGTDLTPMIYSIDLKHFITYRISRTLWPLYIISSIYYNYSFYGRINNNLLSCAILQLIYIGKTHWYEHLQYTQLDAQNKKAGSGWWGLCRHPNYFCEWLTFACWTILQGTNAFFTCFPLLFLTCHLYLRLKHDELRCLAKYGPYWLQYRNRVKCLLIPSLF